MPTYLHNFSNRVFGIRHTVYIKFMVKEQGSVVYPLPSCLLQRAIITGPEEDTVG